MPAKSESQRKAAGMALSAKRGETDVSELKGAAKDMYDSMSKSELEDYASEVEESLKVLTKDNHRILYQRLDESTFIVYDKNTKNGNIKLQEYKNENGKKKLVKEYKEDEVPGKYLDLFEKFNHVYGKVNWRKRSLNESSASYRKNVIAELKYEYGLSGEESGKILEKARKDGYWDDYNKKSEYPLPEIVAEVLYERYWRSKAVNEELADYDPEGEFDEFVRELANMAAGGDREEFLKAINELPRETMAKLLFSEFYQGKTALEFIADAAEGAGNQDIADQLRQVSADLKKAKDMDVEEIQGEEKEKSYEDMTKDEKQAIVNQALDQGDYDTLDDIRPYLDESQEILDKIDQILNEYHNS